MRDLSYKTKERSGLVGILMRMTDEEDRRLHQSIAAELGKAGYGTLSGIITDDCSLCQCIEKMRTYQVDGIVIRPGELSEGLLSEKMPPLNIPLVLVDRTDPTVEHADYVGSDDNECAELAAKHLLDLGHQRFSIVDSDDIYSPLSARAVAFAEYVRVHSRDCTMNHVQIAYENRFDIKPATLFIGNPTAIFCTADYFAPGVYRSAKSYAYEIPADVSVVAVGGLSEFSHLTPRLTLVRQNFESMGVEAAHRLLARMNPGPGNKTARQTRQHLHLEAGYSSSTLSMNPRNGPKLMKPSPMRVNLDR